MAIGVLCESSDLMSYLLFTSKYTNALIEIGHSDASKRIDEIEQFLYSADPGTRTAARESLNNYSD